MQRVEGCADNSKQRIDARNWVDWYEGTLVHQSQDLQSSFRSIWREMIDALDELDPATARRGGASHQIRIMSIGAQG